VWSKLLINRNPSIFESLAAGLAIGISIPALFNISLRLLGFTGVQTGFIFPIACLLLWISFDRLVPALSAKNCEIDNYHFRVLLLIPILNIAVWTPFAWPFFVSYVSGLLGITIFERRTKTLRLNQYFCLTTPLLLFISTAISLLFSKTIFSSPIWKYLIGADASWDEGIAWSVSKYGLRENALFSGNPIKGHLLSHAWVGDLSSTIQSPLFLVSGITGFAVGILGLILVTYSSSILMSYSKIAVLGSCILISVQASHPEEFLVVASPRFPNSISLFFLSFAWFLLIKNLQNKITIPKFVWFCLVFIITISKFHWGLILILAISMLALDRFVFTGGREHVTTAILSIASFTTGYLILVRGISNTDQTYISFDIFFLISILVLILTRCLLISGKVFTNFVEPSIRKFLLFHMIASVAIVWLTNGGNNSTYFLNSTFVFWGVIALPHTIQEILLKCDQQRYILSILFAGLLIGASTSVAFIYLRIHLVDPAPHRMVYWLFVAHPEALMPISCIVVAFVFYFGGKLRSTINHKNLTIVTVAVAFLGGANLGTWLTHPWKPAIANVWQDTNWGNEYAFTDNQISVSEWIKENTTESDVLVSNHFCSKKLLNSVEISGSLDCINRNTISWLAPLARRKVLIESPDWFSGKKNGEQDLYIDSILQNVEDASVLNNSRAFEEIRQLGAGFFVVELARTTLNTWSPHGRIVFRNDDYVILKL
jgi:hypothetical protein